MIRLLACFIVICFSGCLVRESAVWGRRVGKDESAFLKERDVDIREVIQTLGEPSWKMSSPRIFLYAWHKGTETRADIYLPIPHTTPVSEVELDYSVTRRGLFILFDEGGKVVRHEMRIYPEKLSYKDACMLWFKNGPAHSER